MAALDDEAEWIRLCQTGDRAAFEQLVTRYQHMVHSLAYRMTGSLAEAEDLTQEAFLQAWRRIESFHGQARFSSWIHRITVNVCLNWHKRRTRREQTEQAWMTGAATPPASDEAGNDARQEMISDVQRALLKLHSRQRAAIFLTVYEELSHAEAARVLGCAEVTVSWRVFAARRKLKRLLNQKRR